MLPLFILAALAYGAASFAFGASSEPAGGIERWARGLLASAAVLHLATTGAQCLEGNHPFKSVYLATSAGLLLTVVGFLAISAKRRPMRALGAVLAPVGLIGLTLGVVMGPRTGPVDVSEGMLAIHIAAATIGVSGFTLAAGVAGLYLGMDRRVRTKQFTPGESGISLTGLDRLHWWLVLLVTPVFTVAIVTGALTLLRHEGMQMLSDRGLELAAAAVAFLASTVSLVARAAWGLRGRKAAWLTMIAFFCMGLILVSYGLRT